MEANNKNSTGAANTTTQPVILLPRSEGIVYLTAFIVEFLITIIGNAIVIVVFTRARQLRQRKCYWLLSNLAVLDFLVGALAVPFWLYYLTERCDLWSYKPNFYIYAASETASLFASQASLVNLSMVSLERMYATMWPLKHRVLSAKYYQVMIGISWTLPLFLPCVRIAHRHGQISFAAFNYTWLLSTCFFLLVIVVTYVCIWSKIKRYKHPQHHVTTAQNRKLTTSLSYVTAASIIAAFSSIILSVVIKYLPSLKDLSPYSFLHILNCATLLFFVNHIVNPILYSFRMPSFRQAVFRYVCRRSTETRVAAAMDMRNRPEVISRQACPVISVYSPKPCTTENKESFDTSL